MEYQELLQRVAKLEYEVGQLKLQGYTERVYAIEQEILALKVELSGEVPVEQGFRVRNSAEAVPVRHVVVVRPRKDVEFQVGKTIMSLLASFLVLVSLGLFSALVYPMLSDFAKVVFMFAISLVFVGGGLAGMKTKYHTFFTAIAGCGVGAFYLSCVASYLVYGIFGVGFLGVLIYAWTCGVAYLARSRVRVFSYICYLGILVSTGLCMVQFEGSSIALVCYLLGIVTLYMFTRTGDYSKDFFYFMQFPVVCLGFVAYYFWWDVITIFFVMILCTVVYTLQHYLYRETNSWQSVVLVVTETVLVAGYGVSVSELGLSPFFNLLYIFLTGIVAIWSFFVFEDKFCKMVPLYILVAALPILNYGSYYDECISYAPIAMASVAFGYLLHDNIIKGISCGYLLFYVVNQPAGLVDFVFYVILIAATLEVGLLFFMYAFEGQVDRVVVALLVGSTLLTVAGDGSKVVVVVSYMAAVCLSAIFNSDYYCIDDFSQRLGWAWNGFWMAYGSFAILESDTLCFTVVMLLLTLVAFMVNVKWQLECDHWLAGAEFCLKSSWFLYLLLESVSATGVVMSIAFLLLAIGCVVLGAKVSRKIIRLYGLVLSILSVFKCLVFDIQYGSALARPVGLLIAGLLCFGISWVYSVLERKLGEPPEE